MTAFIGIYKAVYDYEPQTPEELTIKEGDLLYLLETSDVDDWWTVKKRVLGSDAEEPVGLVPSNYVEVAPIIGEMRALYDYDQAQNPEEELVFHENELFDLYDDKDVDWLLVKSKTSNQFGFVPGNYVEPANSTTNSAPAVVQPEAISQPPFKGQPQGTVPQSMPAAIAPPITTPTDVSAMTPPPQHPRRASSMTPVDKPIVAEPDAPPMPTRSNRDREDEEAPPPKPTRPQQDASSNQREPSRNRISYQDSYDDDNYNEGNDYVNNDYQYEGHDDRSSYKTWNIAEIDGRKKRKCKLSIGSNKIYFQPQKGEPLEWSIDKLTSYDNEKKHMFLEFVDPYKSLELHTGNNDTCQEIMSVIGECKGASRDAGLREVELASKSKKQGNILYDFIAESQDELTVKQGQTVYILNDKKSRDWWMCELVGTGQRGVIPAQFVEPVKEKNDSSGGLLNSLKKFTKGNSSKSQVNSSDGNWKDDDDQGLRNERKSRNKSRSSSMSSKKRRSTSEGAKKSATPDPKKLRIWADRSGTFKVEAQFIGCADGKIHLHKVNGVKIAVAAEKLSDDDIIYVERATGFSLDKYKSRQPETKVARDSERERRKKLKEQDEKDRDRRLRERELEELKKARLLLDEERAKLQERELPPIKPPRPQSTSSTGNLYTTSSKPQSSSPTNVGASASKNQPKKDDYDWFEFFLNCGVDVSNCQRYTLNFEREQVTEDMLADINPAMLRTLGLKEGNIISVMKYLDKKFGRDSQQQAQTQAPNATGGMFSEPDGSLKVAAVNIPTGTAPPLATNLLPQQTAPTKIGSVTADDDAWTVKPAAKSEVNLSSNKSEFTGSMQDLLDLQPLEPKKKPAENAPQPNLSDLEPVKSINTEKNTNNEPVIAPLDPFKTGGHNLLPMTTGFVMMPIATGGILPVQRTGGLVLPQTTFGVQTTGNALQPQRTAGGSLPMMLTGGFMPQTSFQTQSNPTLVPIQRTGGALPMSLTGGTLSVPPLGTVLPVQKTATGLMPANVTGNVLPMQRTGGALPLQTTGGLVPLQRTGGGLTLQRTGGMVPLQTTGGALPMQMTGGYVPIQRTGGTNQFVAPAGNIIPQTSFSSQLTGGINVMPQTSFGNQITGGANIIPQTTFGTNITGGANMMPQTSFSSNITGGANIMPQTNFTNNLVASSTALPQTSFGNSNIGFGPQTSFNGAQITGGAVQTGIMGNPSMSQPFQNLTGIPQQNPQFVSQPVGGVPQNQLTGQPFQQFPNNFNNGINGITQGLQNTTISQTPALQSQPTGFGFGNGPQYQHQQQPQQQARQANLYNATADNPFGF